MTTAPSIAPTRRLPASPARSAPTRDSCNKSTLSTTTTSSRRRPGADVTAGDSNATPPAEGRAPVTHPYVNGSGIMTIQPNQEIKLTLLVEPHALITAPPACCRARDIGLRRGWIANALAKISPHFPVRSRACRPQNHQDADSYRGLRRMELGPPQFHHRMG